MLMHDTPGRPALQELGHQRVHEQRRRLASGTAEVPWVQQGWAESGGSEGKRVQEGLVRQLL